MSETDVYREGLKALLHEYEVKLDRIRRRARALDLKARAELLPALARELAEIEGRIVPHPSTREDLEAADSLLDAYEKQIDVALAVIAEIREQQRAKAAWSPQRRRTAALAAFVLGSVVMGLALLGRHVDRRERIRRREAYFAGCRQRPECASRGLCGAPPTEKLETARVCHAVSDADCRASQECEEHGKCSARDGVCVATDRIDCTNSNACGKRGECTLDEGACRLLTSADCARSGPCFDRGECTLDQGTCRVVGDADCARSMACNNEKIVCSAVGGKCVASDESCRASRGCKERGNCAALGTICVPGSDSDCAQSVACKVAGHCGPGPACTVSAAGCRASSRCHEAGYCTPSAGECVVGSTADCLSSANCKKYGNCTMRRFDSLTACGPLEGPLEGR